MRGHQVQLRRSGVLRQQHVRRQERVLRVLLQRRHEYFKEGLNHSLRSFSSTYIENCHWQCLTTRMIHTQNSITEKSLPMISSPQ